MNSLIEKLKQNREELGLTIDEVSAKTKIRAHFISSMEDGDTSFLPEIYLRSFYKKYASYMKISDEEVNEFIDSSFGKPESDTVDTEEVSSFRAIPTVETFDDKVTEFLSRFKKKTKSKEIASKKTWIKLRRNNIINYIIYSAIGVGFLAVLYFLFFSGEGTVAQKQVLDSASGNKQTDTTVIRPQEKDTQTFFESNDSLILEAKTRDTSWLRIEIDGKSSSQIYLTPENEMRWSAKEFFILSIGNAGSVQFKRNGVELPSFGKVGTVVRNLKITRTDIISSAAPWQKPDSSKLQQPQTTVAKKPARKLPPKKPVNPFIIEPSTIQTQPYKPQENKSKPAIRR